MITIDLSSEEKMLVKPIEDKMSVNAKHTITLNQLINKWNTLANELENRYELEEFDDYLNNLDRRLLLQKIIDLIPVVLSNKINKLLEPIDQKFISVTIQDY